KRRTPDREARIGNGNVAPPEQCFGPLDSAGHEIAVRALAERRPEAAGEVARRHRSRPRNGRHVERPVELAIHAVLRLAQPYDVADVHGNCINGTHAAVPSGGVGWESTGNARRLEEGLR